MARLLSLCFLCFVMASCTPNAPKYIPNQPTNEGQDWYQEPIEQYIVKHYQDHRSPLHKKEVIECQRWVDKGIRWIKRESFVGKTSLETWQSFNLIAVRFKATEFDTQDRPVEHVLEWYLLAAKNGEVTDLGLDKTLVEKGITDQIHRQMMKAAADKQQAEENERKKIERQRLQVEESERKQLEKQRLLVEEKRIQAEENERNRRLLIEEKKLDAERQRLKIEESKQREAENRLRLAKQREEEEIARQLEAERKRVETAEKQELEKLEQGRRARVNRPPLLAEWLNVHGKRLEELRKKYKDQ